MQNTGNNISSEYENQGKNTFGDDYFDVIHVV